jgi:hypothetical protein
MVADPVMAVEEGACGIGALDLFQEDEAIPNMRRGGNGLIKDLSD